MFIAGMAGTAQAAPLDEPITVRDPLGDVRLKPAVEGLSESDRMSIDLKGFTLTERGRGFRAVFKVRRLDTAGTWDQMFFVTLDPVPGLSGTGTAKFSATAKGYGGGILVNHSDSGDLSDYRLCRAPVKINRSAGELRMDLLARCVPKGSVKIGVATFTGYWNSYKPSFSRDQVRVPGIYTLRR